MHSSVVYSSYESNLAWFVHINYNSINVVCCISTEELCLLSRILFIACYAFLAQLKKNKNWTQTRTFFQKLSTPSSWKPSHRCRLFSHLSLLQHVCVISVNTIVNTSSRCLSLLLGNSSERQDTSFTVFLNLIYHQNWTHTAPAFVCCRRSAKDA